MNIYKIFSIISTCLVATACATSGGSGDNISTAAKSLATQTDALKAVAKTESDAKRTVRRDEAIRYWISHGDDNLGVNLNSSNSLDSFARYVCAGSGALESVNAGITYLGAYSSAAQAAVDPGPDTFAGQFAKFLDQNSAAKVIALPSQDAKASVKFKACFDNIKPLLTIYDQGVPASDVGDEFAVAAIPAVIAAGQKLISSLETLAKDALKVLNQAQQRKHLQDFMKANENDLKQVESGLQNPSKLDDAWTRREVFVLGAAYEKFKVILNDKNRIADAEKIRAAGLEVSSELAAYDSMAATKKPSEVVKAWIGAQTTLGKDVNDESVSLAAIIAFMQSADSELSSIKTDYSDSATKFNALVQSLKTVGK